jgi:hypothetical protein
MTIFMKHLLKPSSRLAVALLTLPFALFLCAAAMKVDEARTAREETVFGTVRDSDSHPIPGVRVEIYSDGDKSPVLFGDTDKNGEYSFKGLIKAPFDIGYSNSGFEASVVTRLAEEGGAHVSKILYKPGEKRPASALNAQIAAGNRIVYWVVRLGADRNLFLEKYRSGLKVDLATWDGKESSAMNQLLNLQVKQLQVLVDQFTT